MLGNSTVIGPLLIGKPQNSLPDAHTTSATAETSNPTESPIVSATAVSNATSKRRDTPGTTESGGEKV
jgi:hypothetical protein